MFAYGDHICVELQQCIPQYKFMYGDRGANMSERELTLSVLYKDATILVHCIIIYNACSLRQTAAELFQTQVL